MAIFKIFHSPKPRQYYHRPIYYNPQEEERLERETRLKTQVEGEEFKSSIQRGSFRKQRWDAPDETADMQTERRKSNIRLFVIIAVLMALAIVLYLSSGAYLAL